MRFGAAVLILMLLAFMGTTAFRVSVPAIAFYTRSVLEASALGIGLLTSSFFAARAIAALLAGTLSDRLVRKLPYIIAMAFILNAIAVYTYSYAHTLTFVLTIRFIQGILNGFAWVPSQYLLGLLVSESFRGRAYSIYFTLGSIGIIAGNALYSLLSNVEIRLILGISSLLFMMSSIMALLLSRFTTNIPPPSSRKRHESRVRDRHTYYPLITITPLVVIVLSTTLYVSIIRGDLIYIYFKEFYLLPKASVTSFIALASSIALIIGYLISWVSDRVGDVLSLRISTILFTIGALLVSIKYLVANLLGLVILYSASSGLLPVSRRIAVSRYRLGGSAIGVVNASGNIGSVLGASIAGYLYDILGKTYVNISGIELTLFLSIMWLAPIVALVTSLLIRFK